MTSGLVLRDEIEVLGGLTAGATGHDYGASATLLALRPVGDPPYRILAPEALSIGCPSGLMLITAEWDWSVDAVTTVKAKDVSYNYSMATEAQLGSWIPGSDSPRAMLYKKGDVTSVLTEGQILLDTFDSAGVAVDTEHLVASSGERPHLLARDDLLLCCWEDSVNTTCYITIVRATVA